MQVHGALGPARGARGVDQNGQVFRAAGVNALLQGLGVLRQVGPAQPAQRFQADHVGVLEATQALHVKHDDLLQARQMRTRCQCFIELFVVFDKQQASGRVLAQVLQLRSCVSGVNAVGDACAGQHGQVGPDPFHGCISQDRSAFAALKAQTEQAACDLANRHSGLVPGPAAPQTQVLLPQPDFGPPLFDSVPEHSGNSLACQNDLVTRLDMAGIPQTWCWLDVHRHVFFFFQRRSPRIPSSLSPR